MQLGSGPVVYSPEALEWLDSTLSEITSKRPGRYVIVITHPMLYDTVYGSLLGEAEGIWKSSLPGYWATREIPEILSKYPQVVAFGGHLHFPLNDPRSIWQGSFTALGCASVRYMALEAGGYEDMAGQTVMKDKDEFSQGNLIPCPAVGDAVADHMGGILDLHLRPEGFSIVVVDAVDQVEDDMSVSRVSRPRLFA